MGHRRLGRLVADQAVHRLYVFGSWNKSEIKDNIQIGSFGAGVGRHDLRQHRPSSAAGASDVAPELRLHRGQPGIGRAEIHLRLLGPRDARTGRSWRHRQADRPALHLRQQSRRCFAGDSSDLDRCQRGMRSEIFSVDRAGLLAGQPRRSLQHRSSSGLKETYFQLNVYNLFDKFYVGGFGGGLSQIVSTHRRLRRPAVRADRRAADRFGTAQHRVLIRPNAGRMRRRPLGGGAVSFVVAPDLAQSRVGRHVRLSAQATPNRSCRPRRRSISGAGGGRSNPRVQHWEADRLSHIRHTSHGAPGSALPQAAASANRTRVSGI